MDPKGPFAARVAAGLRGRGLTLRGLCREAGLDASFFSKVLAGKRSPPSDEALLRRIAELLGLDAVELIVSAGRIPAEWSALYDDGELFREVHLRAAAGKGARPPAIRPIGVARPPKAASELPRREGLSEELL
ncbi:MAG: helix-turn-helix transcriptional regulator [Elusimicrobia bacterium]|nr:helix-turn-helix transcriptional regulator [Elusimicrobiota bacterium]